MNQATKVAKINNINKLNFKIMQNHYYQVEFNLLNNETSTCYYHTHTYLFKEETSAMKFAMKTCAERLANGNLVAGYTINMVVVMD